jgi:hypothetical protein
VRQTQLLSGGDSRSVGNVGDDYSDFDAGQAAAADGLGDGQEVGAAAGEEDAEASSWPEGRAAFNL